MGEAWQKPSMTDRKFDPQQAPEGSRTPRGSQEAETSASEASPVSRGRYTGPSTPAARQNLPRRAVRVGLRGASERGSAWPRAHVAKPVLRRSLLQLGKEGIDRDADGLGDGFGVFGEACPGRRGSGWLLP